MNSFQSLNLQSQVIDAVGAREAIDIKERSENDLISNLPVWTIKIGDNKTCCCDR
ncbi:hypothetical protein HBH47_105610 [Parastagonospora nodorum]|nr:hypothetical protein HBH47_105610 [Parastagonospora nodorum]KAH4236299.1 hypothetical protein HBI05_135300 [Parastagonospora nodorum]KAH4242180.1 hypothetical protein HBI06_015220 [Parastagonospora nodorum]KAH5268355.1 hypothetical protein HBI71_075040 [Parastagonospora nodorum]KAH5321992.1 hypothetical protein HBI50_107090 [Parastagonospora nodorum]